MRVTNTTRLIFGLVLAIAVLAQTSNRLNNASVLKMRTAGLDDSIIVKAVSTSPGDYDTSVDALIALKAGGASEAVIHAILEAAKPKTPAAAQPGSAQAGAEAATDGYPDELGVYYNKSGAYVALEPEIMSVRTTNMLATAYTYGIRPQKVNGWIVGLHSKARLGSEMRDFFLKIPEGVSPTEYTLLRFNPKDDRREVELGRARFSVKMGTEKSAIAFDHEKLSKGKFKVRVKDLKPGEYGFMPPGAEISRNSSSAGKIYTFQVVE